MFFKTTGSFPTSFADAFLAAVFQSILMPTCLLGSKASMAGKPIKCLGVAKKNFTLGYAVT